MRVWMIVCVSVLMLSAALPARGQRLPAAGADEHLWVIQTRRVEAATAGGATGDQVTLLYRRRTDPADELTHVATLHGQLAPNGWAASDNVLYLLYADRLVQLVSVNPSSLAGWPSFQWESYASFPDEVVVRGWTAGASGPWALVQVRSTKALEAIDSPPTPRPVTSGGETQDMLDMALNLPPGAGAEAQPSEDDADQPSDQPAAPRRDRPTDRLLTVVQGRWQTVELPNDWPLEGPVWLVMRRASEPAPVLLTVQSVAPGDKRLWVYQKQNESWVKRTYPIRGSSAIGAAAVSGQIVIAEPTRARDAVEVSLSVVRADGLNPLGNLRVGAPPTSAWAIVPAGLTVALIVEADVPGAQPIDPNKPDPHRLSLAITRMSLLGEVVQEPTPMRRRAVSRLKQEAGWVVLLSALLLAAILAALFLPRDPRLIRVDVPADLELADVTRRVSAGLIDLAPALAVAVGVYGFSPVEVLLLLWPGVGADAGWAALVPRATVIGVFVAHTTLSELLTQRTLGKAVMRLRVVDLTGQPPHVWQLLVRGLLKTIDLVTIFLLLLILGPFRQRLGDIVAQTVVVMPAPPKTKEPDEETKDAEDE